MDYIKVSSGHISGIDTFVVVGMAIVYGPLSMAMVIGVQNGFGYRHGHWYGRESGHVREFMAMGTVLDMVWVQYACGYVYGPRYTYVYTQCKLWQWAYCGCRAHLLE